MQADDIVGAKFGRLTIIATCPAPIKNSGHVRLHVIARCDCGNEKTASPYDITRGHVRSCGCLRRETTIFRSVKHGDASSTNGYAAEFMTWTGMRQRCYDQNHSSYSRYGERGITICERWMNGDGSLTGYECFLADMGRKPSPKHSIDRIDNDGNYEPSNCRWATAKQQANNRRPARWTRWTKRSNAGVAA